MSTSEKPKPSVLRCIDCTRGAADAFEASADVYLGVINERAKDAMRFTCSRCGSEWRWSGEFGGWTEIWELVTLPIAAAEKERLFHIGVRMDGDEREHPDPAYPPDIPWWRCIILSHSWHQPRHTLAVTNRWVCSRCGAETWR